MEKKQKLHNTVQFRENEIHLTTDSEESDVSTNQIQLTPPSKTSSRDKCGPDSASSINTSILDDTEEIKALKEKLADSEFKCKYLETENDKMNADLTNERSRNQKLEKKLQFVKDNQEVFMRLKEAYINMKYNEAAGRKMIEIREKGLQTWDGILCRGCIEAEEMRRQIETVRETYMNSYIIAPYEMEQIHNTVKYMKDLIERREKSWTESLERETKLQTQIKLLEHENTTLRELIKNKNIKIEEIMPEETRPEVLPCRETSQLKKIIVKLEKKFNLQQKAIIFCGIWLSKSHRMPIYAFKECQRFTPREEKFVLNPKSKAKEPYRDPILLSHRELGGVENSNGEPLRLTSPLNEKETKIVQLLMTKYYLRQTNKKSNEKLRSRSASRGPNKEVHPILKTGNPNLKFKVSKPNENVLNNMGFQCDRKADTAIMMMDHLFDSEHTIA